VVPDKGDVANCGQVVWHLVLRLVLRPVGSPPEDRLVAPSV
jgi:hypothetical protein